jgi:hypothetical protein
MRDASVSGIYPGAKVYLRTCLVGQPGTVLREERGRLVVDWCDLKFVGRHSAASLIRVTEATPTATTTGRNA